MPFVLDCSVTMTWCFADEMTAATNDVYARADHDAVAVPVGWMNEVVNALIMGERRNRISQQDAQKFLTDIAGLPSIIDVDGAHEAFRRLPDLCRTHQLTAYDASYLELAMRLDLPLATLDDALVIAARSAGVPLVLQETTA